MTERHAQTCYECWSTFYTTNFMVTTCPTCQQTGAILKSHERQAEAARQRDYENQQRNEIAENNRARAIADAEYARAAAERATAAAVERQNRIIQEQRIKPTEAYNAGRDYIKSGYSYGNPLNLRLEICEIGAYQIYYNRKYETDTLDNEFLSGIVDNLPSLSNKAKAFKDSAYHAGRETAQGTLASCFTLHTGVYLHSDLIPSEAFDSGLKRTIDLKTGELKMTWNEPFSQDTLNNEYARGVNEVHAELNTPLMRAERKATEVRDILKERAVVDRNNAILTILEKFIYLFPLPAVLFAWFSTSGFFAVLFLMLKLLAVWVVVGSAKELWEEHAQFIYRR